MVDVFSKMGMTEFFGAQGDVCDSKLHEVSGEEYSDEIAKGAIIQCLSCGYEVQGNVVRRAKCIVSLGKEGSEQEDEAEQAPEDAPAEGAAAEGEE